MATPQVAFGFLPVIYCPICKGIASPVFNRAKGKYFYYHADNEICEYSGKVYELETDVILGAEVKL